MLKLVELLPTFRKLNEIYSDIVQTKSIHFEQQCKIVGCYRSFATVESYEKELLQFLSEDKELAEQYINNLSKHLASSNELYNAHKSLFATFPIMAVCEKKIQLHQLAIDKQMKLVKEERELLRPLKASLEAIGYREHTKGEEQILHNAYNRRKQALDKELVKLNELQKEYATEQHKIVSYSQNHFALITDFVQKLQNILADYMPKLNPKKEVLFTMELIANIHRLCNNQQFENISEIGLYDALNFPASSTSLKIKKGERIRICYLISKLYDSLNSELRTEWRATILATLYIKENFYQSKYKEAGQDWASNTSREFARDLKEFFF